MVWKYVTEQPLTVQVFKKPEKQKAMQPEWDHTEKKFILQKTEDPGRLDVKTAQGLKK